jgi:TP901 family phage tail tape measure protein
LADQNIVTNITATANFSSLTTQLQAVTAQMLKLQATTIGLNKNLTSQVGVMNRQFDETMRSTGQFSRHFVTLTSDVSKFGANLDSGRMKLGQYFNTWQGHVKNTSTLVKDLAKQQVMLENAIIQPLGKNAQGLMQYNVMVQSGLDATKNKTALMRQELSIMNKVMNDGANQLINWGKNTQWAGRQLTVGLTVPIAAFGMAAAKAFQQADQELTRLTKVYGGLTATSSADLLQVRKDVSALSKELASTLGANFTDTISLAADLAATGKQGTALLESTRQTTRLAVLGEVSRQDAMKATLSIQNAFGENTKQLAGSIDFLNAVENQTSTSLADLVTAIPKAGPVVKALGGDVKDLALYLTAMREGGIGAAEGANAIKSALASIINPTKVAKDMFAGFGIDLAGIVTKNAGNLTGTILALKDSLDKLDPLSRSKAIEQLFGKFQFARMNALFENLGKQGSQTLQVMDLMKASSQDLAGISARELKLATESVSGRFKRALESVKADLSTIGEQFLKVGGYVLNAIDGIVKFIGHMPGPIKAVLGFIAGLTAVAGPIIMLTGVLANFFGYIVKGLFALKGIGKGGTGFKLLTPELIAASAAANTVEESFYNDTKAAATFSDAVLTLASAFEKLKQNAMSSTIATSNSMSTVAGNSVISAGGRIVDKNNPLVGKSYSRDMSHMIPTGSKTAEQRAQENIFSTVPGPKPVNQRISNAPQLYMTGDSAKIPGLTSINGVSTGVVASEAAKWHSMTAAIAMQSEAEIKVLKTEVAATGTITSSLADSYQALLPQMTKITTLAAEETSLIVAELQAGKITVDAARTKIFALNAEVEMMMATTAQGVAAAQARDINLGMVPLTNQPVVSAAGKSNMKELFHKSDTSKLVDSIARALGVRTSGAGYSIQTTKPRFNTGGQIEGFGSNKTQVSGPSSINYDDRMGKIPVGGYVLNQAASLDPRNAPLVEAAASTYNGGGEITALLTPKETVFGAGIQDNPALFNAVHAANNGTPLSQHAAGGKINLSRANYGVMNPKIMGKLISEMFRRNPKLSREIAMGRDLRLSAEEAAAYQAATFGGAMRSTRLGVDNSYFYVGNWGGRLRSSVNTALSHGAAKKADVVSDLMHGTASQALPSLTRFLQVNKVSADRIAQLTERARTNIVSKLAGTGKIGEAEWSRFQHAEYLSIAQELKLKNQYLESLNVPGQRRKHSTNPAAHGFSGETPLNPYNTQDLQQLMAANEANGTNYMGSYRNYGIEKINGEPTALAHMMPGYALGGQIKRSKKHYGIINSNAFMAKNPNMFASATKEQMGWTNWAKDGVAPDLHRALAKKFESYPNGQMPVTYNPAKPAGKLPMPRAYYQDILNADSLHGPLQIGRYQPPMYIRNQQQGARIRYTGTGYHKADIAPAFAIGDIESRAKTALFNYMQGDYAAINDPAVQTYLSTIRTKFTGTLHRGVRNVNSLPPVIRDLVSAGKWEDLIGKEFIMRRSSWSTNKDTAEGFGQLQMVANVKNRNAVPASQIFPDLTFQSASGPVHVNESEVYMGGKFRVVAAGKNKLKLEAVYDAARENGGPVNSGRPYLVGEKGPELFVPKNSGGIIPSYEIGGMIQRGKNSYGITGSKSTTVGNGGVRTNIYGVQGTLPYAPGLNIGAATISKTKAAMMSASKQIEMALYAFATSIKTDAITAGRTLKYSGDQLIVGTRMLPAQIKSALSPLVTGIKSIGSQISNTSKIVGNQIKTAGSYIRGFAASPPAVAPGSYAGATLGQNFSANARYTTSNMFHPIQYLRNRGIGPAITRTDAYGNRTFGSGAVGMMGGTVAGMAAGTAIGGKLGGQNGAMMGSMVGMMAGPALASSIGKTIATRAAASAAASGMAAAGFGTTAAAAIGLVAPLAAVTAAGYAGYKMWQHYKEGQTLNISTFGLTAAAASKAGLRFTDFSSKIKDTIQSANDLRDANKLVYESMKDGGTPFQMTIAEYKKLKVSVKETFGEQIKALDRQPSNKVPDAVRRIKEQLIAAGMSADEATKKVYTMLRLSNKKDQSITATMGNAQFRNINDAQSAAVASVSDFGKSTRTEGSKERAASLNTALMATETGINDLIAKRERLVAQDLTGKTKALTYAEAEQIMITKLNTSKEATTRITAETVAELAKANPQVKKMINGSDTIVSVWQKIRLEALGFNGDLSKLNATQAGILAKSFAAIGSTVESTNRNGILKDQYSNLDKLDKQIKAYTKALKGQSVAAQISDKEAAAALSKQIDANNKLADARKKALQIKQADADLGRQIEKTRLEMQNAASTGDTTKAQSLRIDLESLTSQQQTEAQTRAIDTATATANKPLQAALDALSNKQTKLADSAALAAESLDKIQTKYDNQKAAIDKVNGAMTTLYGNAAAAGKTIEEYVKTVKGGKEASGLVSSEESATGKKMPRYTTDKNGKKVPVSPEQNALTILKSSGTQEGVSAALADSIKGGKTLADVVNAVKGIEPTKALRKDIAVSGDYSNKMESKTFNGQKINVLNAQARNKIAQNEKLSIGETFIWNGQRYGVSQQNGNVVFMGKAATGVRGGRSGIYLVGEKGPEMVHLKSPANIMPNDVMNTLAAASPRYNFNKDSFNIKGQTASAASYVVNQTIYASDGMDVEALSNMIVKKAEVVIGQKAKINVKMVGQGKNI